MPIRVTGMMSGMDTESIIAQLVSAKSVKVNSIKKSQIKASWKMDAWKDLNKKIQNFQTKYVANMRFSSAYMKKTTKVSNNSAVSVLTSDKAMNGVQEMTVDQLAKTGYLTGGKLAKTSSTFTSLGSLSDEFKDGQTGKITINAGNKSVDLTMTKDTTINDVLNKLQDAGLNANFDSAQQRFFISAKNSGAAADFSIVAGDENGAAALRALGLDTDPTADQKALESYKNLISNLSNPEKLDSIVAKDVTSREKSYLTKYNNLVKQNKAAQEKIDELTADDKYGASGPSFSEDDEQTLTDLNSQIKEREKQIAEMSDGDEKDAAKAELEELKSQAENLETQKKDAKTYENALKTIEDNDKSIEDIQSYVTIQTKVDEEGNEVLDDEGNPVLETKATDKLTGEIRKDYEDRLAYAQSIVDQAEDSAYVPTGSATKINGQDAMLTLNGAQFTSSTNTFEINGLTITTQQKTAPGETITMTTQADTDGIYDMIKGFLKEYNELVNEMDKLYGAESAKKFEPLLSEEKDEMSDSEVEEWEKKIKDSLLRRDDNLNTVNTALQSIMGASRTINGKSISLADFGIATLGYFNAGENQKHALHIDGDADDGDTSGNTDKLKALITTDPDTVVNFFTELSRDLYTKMNELSRSQDGYRSFGSFYDNTKMKSDYDDYKNKISDAEKKLNAYEDKWYKKFGAMETALAKMQSNSTAISGLFGGGQ